MSDIRDELASVIEHETGEPEEESGFVADAILASPVIRRIQAEAIREAARVFAEGEWAGAFMEAAVDDDVNAVIATDKWFNDRADRIEQGES